MSAPNLKEIEWAISELENQESSETRYILLAALYTCRNEMLCPDQQMSVYSADPDPKPEPIARYGDSDFLQVVTGVDPVAAWRIMDELMETLHVVNLRVYESVLRKMKRIQQA